MKLRITLLTVAIALFAVIGWTVNAQNRDSSKPTKVTWEYRVEPNPSESKLNELGAQGWEMTGLFVPSSDGNSQAPVVYFKRAR